MKALAWLSLVVAVGVYICGPIVDPDLWWHITFGKWIIAHSSIPTMDYWNMWSHGEPWRAYSWAPEIVLALADRFGAHGLIGVQLVLSVALALTLAVSLSKLANDWFLGLLLGIWATAGCFNHFTLRPQVLVWIYFAALLAVADGIARQGISSRRLALCALIMCAWANTHLSAVIGVVGIFLWIAGAGSMPAAWRSAGASFVGTLVTPYLGGEWITLLAKSGHPFQHRAIAEFQSATIMQYSTAFLIILAVLLMVFLHLRPRALSFSRLFLALGLTAAGLAVVKFLPFAVIAIAACVASVWRDEAGDPAKLGNLAEAIHKFRDVCLKIPREGFTFLCVCISIVYGTSAWRNPINTEIVPVEAVDFMQAQQLPQPILHDFGRGGYIMYRYADAQGSLEHKVVIDGRTNVTPHDVFQKYLEAAAGGRKWREYFQLINPQTVLWPNDSPLVSILLEGQEFCQVFQSGQDDTGYSVFVTRKAWGQRSWPSPNCR
ncbi:MAG: hypothetical protein K1X79_13020 [Oligoflexia bacterium]|nr:hypothetical protein [Oligoflexia bacterium]